MSQCSFCLFFHDKTMHRCSKGLADTEGNPKVGDGKCPDETYEKQGEKYCPSECYECKEMDPKASSEDCKQNVEECKTIDGKEFYLGRPKDKNCPKYDPINPVEPEVI